MSLRIIKAGLLDTVQDGGRYSYRHLGINPGGAMDRFAAALANALLGKELKTPVIELHFPAAQILFQKPAILALTGADFTPQINDREIPLHQPVAVGENSVLSFQQKDKGARCYLSIFNDWHPEPWLNSFSTNLKAGAGGYKGRALQKGDEVLYANIAMQASSTCAILPWKYKADLTSDKDIRIIPGPEWDWLGAKSQAAFLQGTFTITPASDRMGYRPQGPSLQASTTESLLSSAVTFGTVQLLPNGQLIVLMADHQTTGGYPRIGAAISADLPLLAQRGAGENVRFSFTTGAVGEEALIAQQKTLRSLQNTCNLKLQNWLHAH